MQLTDISMPHPDRRPNGYYLFLIAALLMACGVRTGKSFVPAIEGYHDKQREVFVLPDELLEISGLTHLEGDRFAAVNDEKGDLLFIDLRTGSAEAHRFKGKGDYEEIVSTDTAFYILESNGNIVEVTAPFTDGVTYKPKFKGKIEFESMVWYKKLNKLVIITKEQRKKRPVISAFSFDLSSKQFDPEPFFELALKEVITKLSNYNSECKPSSAALHPENGRLYILASVGKLILECSPEGKLIKIYKINPTHFPQPEGISFADNGDMYISNEGLEGKATILKYPYVAHR